MLQSLCLTHGMWRFDACFGYDRIPHGIGSRRRYVHDVSDGIVRATYSFATAIRVGARYFWVGVVHDEEDEYEAYKAAQGKVHEKAARAMMEVVKAHGGLYNKAAQYMSTQNHAMPAEFVSVLSEAQDKARSREFREIERAIKAELGDDALGKKFVWFDPKPVAAASLAQVHRAVDSQGRECAVKVQYPGIDLQIMADVNTFRALLQALEWVFDGFKMSWMLPQFKENLNWELDFAQDGRNGTRCGALLAHGASTGTAGRVAVPQVHWDLTTNKLLTMEWVSGAKATDKATLQALGIAPADVASLVSRAFADMSLVHGLVHIDPHPGNLLVRRKPGAKALPADVQALLKTFPSEQDVKAMLKHTGGNVAGMSFDDWAATRSGTAAAAGSTASDRQTTTHASGAFGDDEFELEELADTLPEGASLAERVQHAARHAKRTALNHVRRTLQANAQYIDDAQYHWDASKATAKRTAQALAAVPLLCVMLPSVAAFGAIKAAVPASVSKPVKASMRSASTSVQDAAAAVLTAVRDGYEGLVGGAEARKEREASAAQAAAAGTSSGGGVAGGGEDTLATLRASTEAPAESFEEDGGGAVAVQSKLPPNSDWQLVLLDHGMYRRLDPGFRMANTALWKALATRDAALGTAAIIDMGIAATEAAKYFEIMCLLLTYRPSSASLGGRMTTSERAATRARFEKGGDLHMSGPEAVNDFIKSLPVDMLFTLRNTAIVRGVNRALGGTTLSRIQSMVEAIGDGYNVEHCTVDTDALPEGQNAAGAYDANGYKYLTAADISVLSAVHAGEQLSDTSAAAAAASGAEAAMVPVQYPVASINLATDTEMALLRAAGALPAGAVRTSKVQGLVRAVQERLAAEGVEVTQEVKDVLDTAGASSMPAWLDSLVFGWYVWLFSRVLGLGGGSGGHSGGAGSEVAAPAVAAESTSAAAVAAATAPPPSAAEQAALAAPEQLAAANRATAAAMAEEREREAKADAKKDDVYEKDFG